MAEQSQDTGASQERLTQTLAAERAALGKDVLLIRENLNLKKKVNRSVQGSPRTWMGVAVGTGLFLGVIVPRLAAAIGGALTPKRRPSVKVVQTKGSKAQEEDNKAAATKGAAMGSLIGGFGSLLIGALRPILLRMIREQFETRVLGRFEKSSQSQSQGGPKIR